VTEALGFPTGCPLIRVARSRRISRIHQSREHRLQARHNWSDRVTPIVLAELGGRGSQACRRKQIITEGTRKCSSMTKARYNSSHQVLHVLLPTKTQKFVKRLTDHFFALKMASSLTRGGILRLSFYRVKVSILYLSTDNPVMG